MGEKLCFDEQIVPFKGPSRTRYNRSKSGWFDTTVFQDWFEAPMLPILKQQQGVKVLIGDNLSSHINSCVVELSKQNNIKFIALHPNSTHLTQPLDVACFKPLKNIWRTTLDDWKKTPHSKRCSSVPKETFPYLLNSVMERMKSKVADNLKAGFRKTGINPINRDSVLRRLPCIENEDELVKDAVGQSFLQHLQKYRRDDTQPLRQKRKAVHVEPGKSVSSEDIQSGSKPSLTESSTVMSKQRQVKKMTVKNKTRKTKHISSSSDSDEVSIISNISTASSKFCLDISSGDGKTSPEVPVEHLTPDNVSAGQYVLVNFQGEQYPGVITAVLANGANVSCMERSNFMWKWPEVKDECCYEFHDLIRKINEPVLKS